MSHGFCSALIANHLSISDRNHPPEMCFWGKAPFLHQRKSVDRLTPTTRTTSLVESRASMPANRSMTSLCSPQTSRVLPHDKKCIEEVGVVISVVNDVAIGRDVSAAQCRKSVHVMGMPIAKVFDIGMPRLNGSEYPFLVIAILEETGARPSRVGTGTMSGLRRDELRSGPRERSAPTRKDGSHVPDR